MALSPAAVLSAVSVLRLLLAAAGLAVCCTSAAHAQILDVSGASLTTYRASGKTPVQDLRPLAQQRAVDIDGTQRLAAPYGLPIGADTLGGGWGTGRRLADLDLSTGAYSPTDIDLALPTLGPPVLIGRTYNSRQEHSSAYYASNGYMGFNWSALSQPELVLYESSPGNKTAGDTLYIVLGADRYIELVRAATNGDDFKAKNGAAGVAVFTSGGASVPDTYTYYDQRGGETTFFGFDGDAGVCAGQFWKAQDSAGNLAYAGHATNPATAITSGFDGSGRMDVLYDASGRRYTFTYSSSTIGGVNRLERVDAEVNSGGWTLVGRVDYTYYTSTESGKGLAGDLKTVTITTPMSSGSDLVRAKYYRYYTSSWSNSDGSRGDPHDLKMAVGFEGVRKYDYLDSTWDDDHFSASEADLKPYAEGWFEYTSSADHRVAKAFFNGECGCGAAGNGTYVLTYGDASGLSGYLTTNSTTYDNAWGRRTVIDQPDTSWATHYFDETGAPMARVVTNSDPSGSPTATWMWMVDRNASGRVTDVYSPAALNAYTHSTGAITTRSSAGMIHTYTLSASGNLTGLRTGVSVKEGTSGSATTLSAVALTDRQRTVGSLAVSIAQVDSTSVYPAGSAITTSYSYTYHSGTASAAGYIVPKTVTTTNPTVTTGNNGSNSATSSVRYVRSDGTTALVYDASGIYHYTGRTAFGQTSKTIADADPTSGVESEDSGAWGLSAVSSEIAATTTFTYDNQGRMTATTVPSVAGTRTTKTTYAILTDRRIGVRHYPRDTGGGSGLYGPVAFSLSNHAGRAEVTATIPQASAGGEPSISAPANTWTGVVFSVYNESGTQLLTSRAFYDGVSSYTSTATSDLTSYAYDDMGRSIRVADPTTTIRRTVYDALGRPTESWMGTADNGLPGGAGGSNNMVKLSVTTYDGGSGGGNSLVTSRTLDPDGNWGTTGDWRTTTYTHDYRGRVILQANPQSPHLLFKYDNQSRVTASGQYSSTSGLTASSDPTSVSTNRIGLSAMLYDERGQVYRSTLHEVVQSGGSAGSLGDAITTDNWYDAAGRLIKSAGATITKTQYDRLGRIIVRYDLAFTDDSAYADADDLTNDVIGREVHWAIDAASGRALALWTIDRRNADSIAFTGALDTNADNDPFKITAANVKGRVQLLAIWYDAWDRVQDIVRYGSNGIVGNGSTTTGTFDRTGAGVPSRPTGVNVHRFSTGFDDSGRLTSYTDANNKVESTAYDAAGRQTSVTANYVNGTPGDGTGDDDAKTTTTYLNGRPEYITRWLTSGAYSQTRYVYGLGGSAVEDNSLVSEVHHPDPATGAASSGYKTECVYNSLGQITARTDPSGNVIAFSYDTAGRLTSKNATTIAGGFDTRVGYVTTSYDARGLVGTVTEYDDDLMGTPRSQVAMTYDDWGNVATMTQDPDGIIGAGGRAAYSISHTYVYVAPTGGPQQVRLDNIVQPGSMTVYMTYGTPDDIDDLLGRVTSVSDNNPLAWYWQSGLGIVDIVHYPEPTIENAVSYSSGVDQLNRPVRSEWHKVLGGGNKHFYDVALTYDQAGNLNTIIDDVLKDGRLIGSGGGRHAHDVITDYNALRAAVERDEGEITTGSVSTFARHELFQRNLAGTALYHRVDLNGETPSKTTPPAAGVYTDGPPAEALGGEMTDTRTIDGRGRIAERMVGDFASPTPTKYSLAYDPNGNMTSDDQLYEYKYDVWCRLVQVTGPSGSPVVANYTYNGLGMRMSEQTDTSSSTPGIPDGVVNGSDSVFFLTADPAGRRVATFRANESDPKETFVWHPARLGGHVFKGGPILRDRNADLDDPIEWDGGTAENARGDRHYFCTDYRGNVVALVTAGGQLAEQARYSATGVPFGIPLGDVTADGLNDSTAATDADYDVISDLITNTTYQARADLDLDGDVDSADLARAQTQDGDSLGRRLLSAPSVGQPFMRNGVEWKLGGNTALAAGSAAWPMLDSAQACGGGNGPLFDIDAFAAAMQQLLQGMRAYAKENPLLWRSWCHMAYVPVIQDCRFKLHTLRTTRQKRGCAPDTSMGSASSPSLPLPDYGSPMEAVEQSMGEWISQHAEKFSDFTIGRLFDSGNIAAGAIQDAAKFEASRLGQAGLKESAEHLDRFAKTMRMVATGVTAAGMGYDVSRATYKFATGQTDAYEFGGSLASTAAGGSLGGFASGVAVAAGYGGLVSGGVGAVAGIAYYVIDNTFLKDWRHDIGDIDILQDHARMEAGMHCKALRQQQIRFRRKYWETLEEFNSCLSFPYK